MAQASLNLTSPLFKSLRDSLQHNGKLQKLDLSAVPDLAELDRSSTPITELDIRPLNRLKILFYDVGQTRLLQRSDQDFERR